MSSAISCGSISGRAISMVFTSMCRRVSFSSALVSFSIFSPFLPMIAPTRLLLIVIVTRSRVRSILMSEMAGRCSLRSFLLVRYFWMKARTFASSMRSSEKSAFAAYHVDRQGRMIPVRKPVGRTF